MSRSISRKGALVTFYAAGALLCGVSLFPGWLSHGTTVVGAVGALAAVVATCLGLLRRLSVAAEHVLVAAGSGLVAVVVGGVGGGVPSAGFAVYSLFIAIYAGLFFSTGAFVAHLGGCLALVTFALAQTATDSGQVAHLALLLGGTMAATGTVLRLLVRQVTELSTHDLLTGLYNETGLRAAAAEFSAQAAPEDTTVVLLIDVDRFAGVNDALGRDAGDDLLRMIGRDLARRYTAPAPTGSTAVQVAVGRIGADVFAVVLTAEHVLDAAGVPRLDSLLVPAQSAARGPHQVGGIEIETTVTVGVAFAPAQGKAAAGLLQQAAVALVAAKRDGQPAAAWSAALDQASAASLSLQQDLRVGIMDGQLRLLYQPIVISHSGAVAGVEALVRWDHPRQGMLAPAAFLPHAEQSQLIVELTAWVLEEAVRQAAQWQSAGDPLPVSVNLSARLLVHDGLRTLVAGVLQRHGLSPDLLTLEVTESAVMTRPDRAAAALAQLRGLGVRISIDDFGTGYTSLALLADLPVDELKVDRRFVDGALRSRGDAAIVRTVIQLGHRLGLKVVGEGVEDQDTQRLLAELGCDLLQGYHFSRPATPTVVEALVREQRRSTRGPGTAFLSSPYPLSSPDEEARLASLRRYAVLDTPAERFYDDVAALAAHICGTSVALISLIDGDRQWFKARVGLDVTETPRQDSFCAHTVGTGAALHVPDMTADPRFADNPFVTGEAGVRFYAGAPLVTRDGHVLGSLCVIDQSPKTLTSEQSQALEALARTVMTHLEVRSRVDMMDAAPVDAPARM